MAELGIIAAVAQIADVGLRLSIKLYTFGEVVASADRAVISISKDVSLTSGVLKELGQILEKDRKSRTFSENAIQTADGVVKECLEVFQEMDSILVKKLPSLGVGRKEERPKRAMVLLEKLKWGYLQPKLQLLRSNLDRLKSTLLLMLNVITYARQVSEKTESPSVIAEQRSLIEDLAHSNQENIRDFENLKLGIGGDAVENAENISIAGAVETESSTKTEPVPPALKPKLVPMSPPPRTPLQDGENTRGLEFNKSITATNLYSPNARSRVTKLSATPPYADTNNLVINTSGPSNITLPPLQVPGNLTTEAPLEFDQDVLFKQLRYFSMLVQDLLKEVDGPQYKITFQSRLRMKGGIVGLHAGERRELEKVWGCTALQKAEQRLEFFEESVDSTSMSLVVPSGFRVPAEKKGKFKEQPSRYPMAVHQDKLILPTRRRTRRMKTEMDEEIEIDEVSATAGIEQSTNAPIVGDVKPRWQAIVGHVKPRWQAIVGHVKPRWQYNVREEGAHNLPYQSGRLSAHEQSEASLKEDTSLAVSDDVSQQELDPARMIGYPFASPPMDYSDEGFERFESDQSPDASERESTNDVSQSADTELVDHLVSLWTTLKL